MWENLLLASTLDSGHLCFWKQNKTKPYKNVAPDITYSPWGGKKSPWFCFMVKLLTIFSFLTAFLCFCPFSFLWLNVLLGTQGRPRRPKLFCLHEERHTEGGRSLPEESPSTVPRVASSPRFLWHASVLRGTGTMLLWLLLAEVGRTQLFSGWKDFPVKEFSSPRLTANILYYKTFASLFACHRAWTAVSKLVGML